MIEKIIVKRDPQRLGSKLILFFPDSLIDSRNDRIGCYYGNYVHGECSLDFYRECKHLYRDYDNGEDIALFLSNYVRYIRSLPGYANYGYKRVFRLSRK